MIPTYFRQSSFEEPLQQYCSKLGKILQSIKDFWWDAFFLGWSSVSFHAWNCVFVLAAVGVNAQHFLGGVPRAFACLDRPPRQPPPCQLQLLHLLRQDPARLRCAHQSSLLPIQGPGGCQKVEFCSMCFSWGPLLSSPAPFAFCAGQGLTLSLLKPWIKKHCLRRLRWD